MDHSHFFPVLPYGFNDSFDMTGWYVSLSTKKDGILQLVKDHEINSYCSEIQCKGHHKDTFISFPDKDSYIGTELPLLICYIKNISQKCSISFEVTDKDNNILIFHTSNAQSIAKLTKNTCSFPLHLKIGWNKLCFDLNDLCQRVFDTKYAYANTIKVYANCRIRNIYFTDRKYKDQDLPKSLKVFPNK